VSEQTQVFPSGEGFVPVGQGSLTQFFPSVEGFIPEGQTQVSLSPGIQPVGQLQVQPVGPDSRDFTGLLQTQLKFLGVASVGHETHLLPSK
jgi:hypothetical protein